MINYNKHFDYLKLQRTERVKHIPNLSNFKINIRALQYRTRLLGGSLGTSSWTAPLNTSNKNYTTHISHISKHLYKKLTNKNHKKHN